MKAIICRQHGLPNTLNFEEILSLVPGPKQVVIRVHAAGVNFPDTLIIQGTYQFKPELPFTPGSEVAGVILRLGADVTGLNVGDRVLSPIGWGGFAEEALADAWRVLPIPSQMDFVTASSFMVTYGTSYHALKDRARLRPGESLLVLGAAGGVGLAAIEIGKSMGARVIAAASSDEKLEICRQHGADEVIQYSRDDLRTRIKEITGESGVDVVYDPVGGRFSEAAVRSTAWNGRYLVIGFATGDVPKIALNLPLLKGCSIVGVFWGTFCRKQPDRNNENSRELLELYVSGKLKPHICARFPLERAADAMTAVMNREAMGKVVVEMQA